MPFQHSILLVCSLGLTGSFRLPSASAGGECSASSLRECLALFTIGQFDVYHLDDDIPTWNESLFRVKQRCQTYTIFAVCVEPMTASCNSSLQLALEGLANAYEYLCTSNGIADFASNQSCYLRPEVREMAKICNQSYSTRLSTIAYSDNAVSLYCRYVDDYIDCLTTGLTLHCDSRAAKWQYDWIRNLRQPQMQISKCSGWVAEETSSNVWATALLVALALITVLMIVGIVTLVVFIIRKRMFRERLRRSLDGSSSAGPDGDTTPLPPPYSIVVETPGPDGQLQPHLVDSLSPGENTSSSSNRRDVRQGTTAASSVPFKVPILPPPYYERPEESAPPYYEFPAGETSAGRANDGFVGEEGGGEKSEEDLRVIRSETGNNNENKAEMSEA